MSSGGGGSSNEAITVVVRCRPMNRKETDEKRSNIVDVDPENRSVGLRSLNPGEESKYFTFDATYDEKTQQRIFYDESCFNIIESALEGFNATIFAYGQTGCGKRYVLIYLHCINELGAVLLLTSLSQFHNARTLHF
jgi:kinesin family protein 3/17